MVPVAHAVRVNGGFGIGCSMGGYSGASSGGFSSGGYTPASGESEYGRAAPQQSSGGGFEPGGLTDTDGPWGNGRSTDGADAAEDGAANVTT